MKSFKAIGALLDYPQEEMLEALPEIVAAVAAEPGVSPLVRARVAAVADYLAAEDAMTLQERYVETFDRGRRTSLHLYEHLHGEGRDRGMAMVNLAQMYRLHGFELSRSELPDYLPLFCEFLAQIPDGPARSLLAETTDILEAVRRRLVEKGSPYAGLLEALILLSGRKVDPAGVDAILAAKPADPETNDDLDAVWAEDPVGFGAGAAMADVQMTCPHARPQPRPTLSPMEG